MRSCGSGKLHDAIPVLITICILPFVVYGHIYEYTDDSCGFFLEGGIYSDFFSYTRGLAFGILGLYMTYRLVSDHLQGRTERPCFVMSAGFIVMGASLLISALFALNKAVAFAGGYQRFEGFFIKVFYLVLALYTYHISGPAETRSLLRKGAIITAALESIVGLAQMTGHDPFAADFIRRLILPGEYEGADISNILGDNRVYLTLANPNYASIYLAAAIILVTWSVCRVKDHRYIAGLAALDILCFSELVATRSRVGILMLAAAGLTWVMFAVKDIFREKKKALLVCGLLVLMLAAGIAADRITGLGSWERLGSGARTLGQDRRNCSIDDLKTGRRCVEVRLGDDRYSFSFGDSAGAGNLVIISDKEGDISRQYDTESGSIQNGPEGLLVFIEEVNGEPMIVIEEGDACFYFAYDDELGYMIYTGNGYYDFIEDIPHVDMHGLEPAASGRGYIWSRSVPLLRGIRAVMGWGPDNFYLAFPQNDYLGKAQYSSGPYTIIEKPHNTYLLYGIENGIAAAIALLVLIAALTARCLKKAKDSSGEYMLTALIMIAFASGFFFNDSSIVISPFFWIVIGAGYRLTDESSVAKGNIKET